MSKIFDREDPGEVHQKSIKLFEKYLRVKFKRSKGFLVKKRWPTHTGPRSDLSVIKLPKLRALVWVEVQDTNLPEREWERKLIKAQEMSEKVYIVLTPNLIKDLPMIRKIASAKLRSYRIFTINPLSGKIKEFEKTGKTFEIKVVNNNILRREISSSLNSFPR